MRGPIARPLPTVLQNTEHDNRLSSSSRSAESSNHASGESWFNSGVSSQSSHFSSPPLPKGARPPSPQTLQVNVNHPVLSTGADSDHHTRADPPLTRNSSLAWNLQWRRFSKVVNWTAPSEKEQRRQRVLTKRSPNPTHNYRDRAPSTHRPALSVSATDLPPIVKPLPGVPLHADSSSSPVSPSSGHYNGYDDDGVHRSYGGSPGYTASSDLGHDVGVPHCYHRPSLAQLRKRMYPSCLHVRIK